MININKIINEKKLNVIVFYTLLMNENE